MEPLNLQGIYDVIFIGGGPAALGVLIHSLRRGYYKELLFKKLLILEKGLFFGSGAIEKLLNNANSPAIDVLRLILKEPECNDPNFFDDCQMEQNVQLVSPFKQVKLHGPKHVQGSDLLDRSTPYFQAKHQQKEEIHSQDDFVIEQQQQKQVKHEIPARVRTSIKLNKIPCLNQQMIIQKMEKYTMLVFREVLQSKTFYELLQYGFKQPPISMFGYFLRILGNTLLRHIKNIADKQIFKYLHEVVAIQLQSDGYMNIRVKIVLPDKKMCDFYGCSQFYKPSQQNNGTKIFEIFKTYKAKCVILCNGGQNTQINSETLRQIPPEIHAYSLQMLQDEGYVKILKKLKERENEKKKVVIVGGGHSAFYTAQVLLFGPKIYKPNEFFLSENAYAYKFLGKSRCETCCRCSAGKMNVSSNQNLNISPLQKSYDDDHFQRACNCKRRTGHQSTNSHGGSYKGDNSYMSNFSSIFTSASAQQSTTCQCECYCYGSLKESSFRWKKDEVCQLEFTDENPITIVHRSDIRVFFESEQKAQEVGYIKYDRNHINQIGQVYPYKGLKGTNKLFYYDIKEGIEKRVKLVQIHNDEELKKVVDGADLVVEACGFKSNVYPIFDYQGKEVKLLYDIDNYVQMDEQGRIISDRGSIKNLFGIGLGYAPKLEIKTIQQNKDLDFSLVRINTFLAYQEQVGINCIYGILLAMREQFSSLLEWEWFEKKSQLTEQAQDTYHQQRRLDKQKTLPYDDELYPNNDQEDILDHLIGLNYLKNQLIRDKNKSIIEREEQMCTRLKRWWKSSNQI